MSRSPIIIITAIIVDVRGGGGEKRATNQVELIRKKRITAAYGWTTNKNTRKKTRLKSP